MKKRRTYGEAGTTLLENAAMDLWDAGLSRERIQQELGERLGVSAARIDNVLSYMLESDGDRNVSGHRQIAGQTASLLAALRLHHPDRCGA